LKKLIRISDSEVVDITVEVLKRGGIVIFPTDTLYGLLGVVENRDVLERLVSIKGREEGKPFPIFVSSIDMAKRYIEVDENVKKLFDSFLPGPLTVVAKALRYIPYVTSGEGKIGVRIPEVSKLIVIVESLGVAVTGTSANFSGKVAPKSFEEIDPDLFELVDLAVDGGTLLGKPSTVFDVVDLRIIREGAIDGKEIFRCLKENK